MPSTLPSLRPYSIDSAEQELQADFVAAINRVLYDIAHELNEQLARDLNAVQPESASSNGACDDVQQLPIRFVFSQDQLAGLPPAQDCITVTPVPFRLNRNRRAWSQCAVLDWKLKDKDIAVDFHFPPEAFLAGHLYQCLVERKSLSLHLYCITGAGSSLEKKLPSDYYEYALWTEQGGERPTRDDARKPKLVQIEPPEWKSPDKKDSDFQQLSRLYLNNVDLIDEWCQRFIILLPVYDTRPYGHAFGDVAASLMLNVGIRSLGHTSGSSLEPATRQKYLSACEVVVERTGTQLNRLTELIAAEIHKAAIIQASTQQPKWNHDLLEHFVFTLRLAQSWDAVHVYKGDRYLYSYGWTRNEKLSGDDHWERQVAISDDWLLKRKPRALFAPNGTPESIDRILGKSDSSGSSVEVVIDEAIRWDAPGFYSSNGNGLDDLQELAGVQIIFEFTNTARIPGPESQYRRAFCRELQYQQLDVIRTIRPAVRMRRSAVRNAVSAIMGRNMSHNIGSHVLARLAASELDAVKSGSMGSAHASRAREALLSYLQRRMDFVAEVSTADRAYWSQPLSLESVVSCLNYPDEYKRITAGDDLLQPGERLSDRIRAVQADRRPLLLSFITGKETLSASVEFKSPAGTNPGAAASAPTFFSCPGGEVGAHALLVILENIVRNSARHGDEFVATMAEPVVIHVVPQQSARGADRGPFTEVRIIDLHTRLTKDGKKSRSDVQSVPQKINAALNGDSLIDQNGQPNPRNWGVREMQICAHYLRHLPLSMLESVDPATRKPAVLKATCEKVEIDGQVLHCLAYTIHLQKPRLVAVLAINKSRLPNGISANLGIRVFRLSSSDSERGSPKFSRLLGEISEYSTLLYAEELEAVVEAKDVRASLPMLRLALNNEQMSEFLAGAANDGQRQRLRWFEWIYARICSAYLRRKRALDGKKLYGVWAVDAAMDQPQQSELSFRQNAIVVTPKTGQAKSGRHPLSAKWSPPPWELLGPAHNTFLGAAWIDHPQTRPQQTNSAAEAGGGNDFDAIEDSPWQFWHAYRPAEPEPQQQSDRWISVEPGFFECAHRSQRDRLIRDGVDQELLCAAVSRVAIIDERVQSGLTSDFRTVPLRRLWAGIGVWVPDRSQCHLDSPKWEDCRKFLNNPSTLQWQFPIDVLVIHLTVLEALRKQCPVDTSLDQCLEDLRKGTQADHSGIEIVVVTGRGVTGTAMSHRSDRIREARYLPISAVQEHVLTRPSKLGLMRALWNSRRVEVASSTVGAH